jgi:hypothetical protein
VKLSCDRRIIRSNSVLPKYPIAPAAAAPRSVTGTEIRKSGAPV